MLNDSLEKNLKIKFGQPNNDDEQEIINIYVKRQLKKISGLNKTKSTEIIDNERLKSENDTLEYYYAEIVKEITHYIGECCNSDDIVSHINQLSQLKYESSPCSGNIAFCKENVNINFEIPFNQDEIYKNLVSFSTNSNKFIRKLLQLTHENTCLVLCKDKDKWNPLGIAKIEDCNNFPIFKISGTYKWNFYYTTQKIAFGDDQYYYTKNSLYKEELPDELNKALSNEIVSSINCFVQEIKRCSDVHGALFIFIEDSHLNIIERLCEYKRGIMLGPSKINLIDFNKYKNLFISLCKIDGALIFSKNTGQLLAIGVILDGKVSCDGDIGRGSRFNSTKTFTDYYTVLLKNTLIEAFGIVVSEDGYVNFITAPPKSKYRKISKADEL